jgi:hypothetical protein
MTVTNIFAIPIFEDTLDIDHQALVDWCIKSADTSKPLYCGHFIKHLPSIHDQTPLLADLSKKIVASTVRSYFKMQNPAKDFSTITPPPLFVIKRMWCNVYTKNGYMDPHNHYEVPYAGTLYLTSSPAKLAFYHPSQYRPNDRYTVTPEPGKLVVWPGWLTHQVEPNFTDDIRVSISFKLEFIKPNIDSDGRRMDDEIRFQAS